MWRTTGALVAILVLAACTDHDPADRRVARQDEYALDSQGCEVDGGRVVEVDGDVDVGRPQTVEHPDSVADGASWAWQVGLAVDRTPADVRCNVIQVVIGDDVSR